MSTKLISRKHVKDFALAVPGQRAHQFTRVGGQFSFKVEVNVKEFIRCHVKSLPSKGKTIT